eukprot:scaffold48_cov311-Pinguiococcus_pyrenoidosus.AAC.149
MSATTWRPVIRTLLSDGPVMTFTALFFGAARRIQPLKSTQPALCVRYLLNKYACPPLPRNLREMIWSLVERCVPQVLQQ